MDTLLKDIRYGTRMLIKYPMVTATAIITLALGIGANTAIFSALNGFLFKPLPVQNPDRLVVIADQVSGQAQGSSGSTVFSYADFQDIRAQAAGFSSVIGYDLKMAGLEYEGKTDPLVVNYVTADYFPALGLVPAHGRLFSGPEVEKKGVAPDVVLGYSYWKRRFNLDPEIVGRQVRINGHAGTVIGVAPEGFHGLFSILDTQVYLPIGTRTSRTLTDDFFTKRDNRQLRIFGVLKPGVKIREAQSSLDVVMQRMSQQYPEDKGQSARIYPEWKARPVPDPTNSTLIAAVLFMMLAGLVLLLACTNVANIVLVRATARGREMAVRAALGAARSRLVRQLLTESLLLAFFGGVAGLFLGVWASRLMSSIRVDVLGKILLFDFSFDWRVFAFGTMAALLTGLVVGCVPAWRLSRADLNQVLNEGSRGVLAGTARSRLRSSLVVAQVAGSLMLLIVAGLFVRSSHNAEHIDLGFDPDHVLNLTMDTRNLGFDEARSRQFYRDLEDRAQATPGVLSATLAVTIPMGPATESTPIYVEGQPVATKEAAPVVYYNAVTPSYFTTMRVPLLRGHGFTLQDTEKSPHVAIVNEQMAKQFWPKGDPIGKRFSMTGAAGPFFQIVGLTGTGKYTGPAEDPTAFFYVPLDQVFQATRVLQLRTGVPPEVLAPQIESQIQALAPGLPVFSVEDMKQTLEGVNGMFLFRMGSRLSTALGGLGLILALVGVYGVVSYVATQRTHEIGVRMALGASRVDILKLILRQGLVLVGSGAVIGLLLTVAVSRGLADMLVGVSPTDPLTLGLVTALLVSVGVLASLVPARRATLVEPLQALRHD
ncbi:MAG TPA: ABC transporter permease [Alphaproteobacteria bacterium]|nr:ABC transporter permease [Alphaproteobacteria bacterium]